MNSGNSKGRGTDALGMPQKNHLQGNSRPQNASSFHSNTATILLFSVIPCMQKLTDIVYRLQQKLINIKMKPHNNKQQNAASINIRAHVYDTAYIRVLFWKQVNAVRVHYRTLHALNIRCKII